MANVYSLNGNIKLQMECYDMGKTSEMALHLVHCVLKVS